MKIVPVVNAEGERNKKFAMILAAATEHLHARGEGPTREAQLLAMAAVGDSDRDMAESLEISPSTVNSYWRRLLRRLQVGTRTEAVALVLLVEVVRLKREIASLKEARPDFSPEEAKFAATEENQKKSKKGTSQTAETPPRAASLPLERKDHLQEPQPRRTDQRIARMPADRAVHSSDAASVLPRFPSA